MLCNKAPHELRAYDKQPALLTRGNAGSLQLSWSSLGSGPGWEFSPSPVHVCTILPGPGTMWAGSNGADAL